MFRLILKITMIYAPIIIAPASLIFATTGASVVGLYSCNALVPADVQKPLTLILSFTATKNPDSRASS